MLKGNRLKEVRKKKGLTQTELGDLIGVGKSEICCYERELRNPSLEALTDLMYIFGVSADYLLGMDCLIETKDKRGNIVYPSVTKEEIIFIDGIKEDKLVYEILLEDPRRGAELVKREIG